MKRALYSRTRALHLWKLACVPWKEPYLQVALERREPCKSWKSLWKEPYNLWKEPHEKSISWKNQEPCVFAGNALSCMRTISQYACTQYLACCACVLCACVRIAFMNCARKTRIVYAVCILCAHIVYMNCVHILYIWIVCTYLYILHTPYTICAYHMCTQ